MTAYYLFDGGNYKRGEDDGRSRVPLTAQEAELIVYDPELQKDAQNSIKTEFNMMKWARYLCNLAVDDQIFVGVVPDSAFYRGLWMGSFDAVPGLTVDLDLVSVAAIRDAYDTNNGDVSAVPAWYTAASGTLAYDFADGLGNASIDADQLSDLYGGTPGDYRNNAALKATSFASSRFAGLGEALYFRLTVTAVPQGGTEDDGCCSRCGNDGLPTFEVGAVYDRLCFDKQRVRKFCNCPQAGCGCDSDDCG